MKKLNYFLVLIILSFVSCGKPNLYDGIFANIDTDKGTMIVELYYENTPLTVANFIELAEGTSTRVVDSLKGEKFYDGLPFHRVIKNFMIQGGDIKRNGTGDPGYRFEDEFPRDSLGKLLYTHKSKGTLSMANSGPNTNGSQFFITHKPTPWLDGKHSIFGTVIHGLEVVDSIEKGDLIQSVKIIRKGRLAKKFTPEKAIKDALQLKEKNALLAKQLRVKDSLAFSIKMDEASALVLPSGLKIRHLLKGKGPKIIQGDAIKVHYSGYFVNGKKFDSSVDRNQTFDFVFGVDRVINGWTEGISNLSEGGKANLFIPYELAYGVSGYGPIPPKADLIFEVEIVKVSK